METKKETKIEKGGNKDRKIKMKGNSECSMHSTYDVMWLLLNGKKS